MENMRITQWIPMLVTALIGGIVVLLVLIGVSSLVGLLLMIAIVGLNRYLSSKTKQAEKLNLMAADKRLTLMRQLIEGIQALKMHGWESKFLSKIEHVRKEECEHIQNFRILQVVSIALGRASPVLASMAAFVTFVLLGNNLTTADIFAALTIFQALRMPLIMIPLSLTALMNMKVSFTRIASFLRIKNVSRIQPPSSPNSLLLIQAGSFAWNGGDEKQDSIDVDEKIEKEAEEGNNPLGNANTITSLVKPQLRRDSIGNEITEIEMQPRGSLPLREDGSDACELNGINENKQITPHKRRGKKFDNSRSRGNKKSMQPTLTREISAGNFQFESRSASTMSLKTLNSGQGSQAALIEERIRKAGIKGSTSISIEQDAKYAASPNGKVKKRVEGTGASEIAIQVRRDNMRSDGNCGTRYSSSNVSWTLRNIGLNVPRGTKVAIVGSVGSGKSSLLHGLLGDLVTSAQTKVSRTQSCGWVPQKAYVLSATIRDNILMGRPFDQKRFDWAIWAAAMTRDLSLLPHGISTEIGERGTTLSGGQQQRLAIARAIYGMPDLLVMDDPLAAVDSRVSETIFERCVQDYVKTEEECNMREGKDEEDTAGMGPDNDQLRGKRGARQSAAGASDESKKIKRGESEIDVNRMLSGRQQRRSVVMALNQVHFLDRFDWVVCLENGSIVDQDSYHNMVKRGHPGFMKLLSSQQGTRNDDLDEKCLESGALEEKYLSKERNGEDYVEAKLEGCQEKGCQQTQKGSDAETEKEKRKETCQRTQQRQANSDSVTIMGVEEEKEPSTGPEMQDKRRCHKNEKAAGAEEAEGGKLVEDEKVQQGAVTSDVIVTYIKSMGVSFVVLCAVVLCLAYAAFVFNDVWLAMWASESPESRSRNLFFIGIYIASSIGHVALILLMSCLMAIGGVRASHVLHKQILERVIKAPTKWFQETPSGRIMSRFSSDLSVVDVRLALFIDNYLQIGAIIFVLLATMCVTIPPVTGFVAIGMSLYSLQVLAVDRSNREVRRIVNNAMSPLLTNFSETAHGRLLTQTMGLQSYFLDRHLKFTDKFTSASLASYALISWGRHASNVSSFIISLATALLVILQRDLYTEAQVSLALTYAFLVPYFLMVQSMNASFISVGFTSLERVLEYKSHEIPQEKEWRRKDDPTPDVWPLKGQIEFDEVALVYREGLPPAIKGVSFAIKAGKTCGVVGRTGAGKSSLVVSLFRIVERSGGRILVDGKDIGTLGLQTVREALSIIPQQPLLLQGTVRHNLDPFDECSEKEIQQALVDVGLSPSIVDSEVGPGGSYLSAGERQLISFGRALLSKAKIIVMDEPTANIDINTDDQIQRIVREKFKGSTIITIAHRLSTIIDYDMVLVMDAGKVAEYGPAAQLLQLPEGILTSMVNSAGEKAAQKLRTQCTASVR
eukprot:CAMPEP_0184506154 /NCGR_PEP_ID=MMETSP0113_2-20130426/53352_1 /TAXON_ID=91329 /ORGANISM="Norrisiella sphaerica, Strain BC52" /LENGTH=1408 /DNA_ID=CAMNT_0026895859 /DNA_START=1010 /DNA_END=5236 /DNA_ORIENTATION=+